MEVVRERIKGKGMIQIPREIMEKLRLSEGDEIALRIEASKLVIDPIPDQSHVFLPRGVAPSFLTDFSLPISVQSLSAGSMEGPG
jgi:bifunctional DNA-binding transcriptional regulator/antitoxin component of YhaV-PrlF toxin-antitoxin module